jgi:hypothetical protein
VVKLPNDWLGRIWQRLQLRLVFVASTNVHGLSRQVFRNSHCVIGVLALAVTFRAIGKSNPVALHFLSPVD